MRQIEIINMIFMYDFQVSFWSDPSHSVEQKCHQLEWFQTIYIMNCLCVSIIFKFSRTYNFSMILRPRWLKMTKTKIIWNDSGWIRRPMIGEGMKMNEVFFCLSSQRNEGARRRRRMKTSRSGRHHLTCCGWPTFERRSSRTIRASAWWTWLAKPARCGRT